MRKGERAGTYPFNRSSLLETFRIQAWRILGRCAHLLCLLRSALEQSRLRANEGIGYCSATAHLAGLCACDKPRTFRAIVFSSRIRSKQISDNLILTPTGASFTLSFHLPLVRPSALPYQAVQSPSLYSADVLDIGRKVHRVVAPTARVFVGRTSPRLVSQSLD